MQSNLDPQPPKPAPTASRDDGTSGILLHLLVAVVLFTCLWVLTPLTFLGSLLALAVIFPAGAVPLAYWRRRHLATRRDRQLAALRRGDGRD